MEIEYQNKKLQKLLENHTKLVQKYGVQNANKIVQRMGEIQAATCLADLMHGRPHPHKGGNRRGLFSLDIKHPLRLIIEPIGDFDLTNYRTIKAVNIYEIMDPH